MVLGSAALLLPLTEPVGQRAGAVARHLLAMAAIAMASPAQAQTTCSIPDFGGRRDIWTGTVTVQNLILPAGNGYFDGTADGLGRTGALSDTDFDIGENRYTIDVALIARDGSDPANVNKNDLVFSLMSDLTAAELAALKLHVCDTTYDFSAADHISLNNNYSWNDISLDWSSESTRTLYLSLPANHPATGTPTISGTAEFGEMLTAATSDIADTDGLPTSFQYQWLRENQDGTGQETIADATSSSYTLGLEDVGKKVRVQVSFTDQLSGMEEVTSVAYPATGTVTGSGVSVDATSLSADEGETLTYTVELDAEPTGNVTITSMRSGDTSAVSVSPASLTFTTSNWNTARTVSVTAEQDADGADEMVTISHSVSGGYGAVTAAAAVTVTVDDDDVPGVSVMPPASSSLSEGSGTTITYTMKLDTEPTGNVTIAPDSGVDSNAVSVSPASLIFTTSNWNTARTVSVTAMEDFDATNEMVSISHAVSGADYASVTADSVNVIVTDNDTRSVTVSGSPLTINEGGTGTYSVVLTSQPTDAVTVMPSRSGDPDVTVSAALTFSTSNWNTPQTVTVSAAEDNDADNDTATIAHAVSGADYASITAASIDVTVIDNDTRGITLSEPDLSLSLNEGSSVTYTVVLNTQPTGEVTVTPSRSGDPDVTVSDALTFFTTNWNTPQTVTVSAAEDNDADNDTATIAHAVSGADYASITAASIDVTVTDNDTRGITLSEPDLSLSLNEGSSVTYTVVLNIQPTDAVTVTPSRSSGDMDVTVSAALTFSTSNWDTPQTVTVSAAEDNDASNDTATITHDVSGADYDTLTADPVQVTVNDNEAVDDTAPMVIFILRQAPIASPTNGDSLMWRVTFSEVVENVDATDFTVSGSTATVTNVVPVGGEPLAYDVTVSGGNLAGLDGTVRLGFASGQDIQDEAGTPLATPPPPVADQSSYESYEVDNTPPTVRINVPATSSAPFTATITFSEVVSGFAETDITVSNSATLSPLTETTPGTVWTVQVTPTAEREVTLTIPANVAEDAAGNGNLAAPPARSAYAAAPENDEPSSPTPARDRTAPRVTSITRQAPGVSPTNGDSLTWRVVFSETVTNVDGTDFTVSGSTATVTNVEQVGGEPLAYDVTVSGGDLAGLDGTVTLGFATGQDIEDAAGNALAITPSTGSSNNSYLVDNTAPMLTYTPPTVLTVGTAITVIAPTTTDDDIARTSATGLPAGLMINTTTGAISGTPTTASPATSVVVVTVTDNAGNQTEVRLTFPAVREAVQPGVSVAPTTSLSLNEGETAAYTLVLETPPPGNVTITPTSGDSGAVSVSPARLTFTPSNWDTPRTVTVTGVNDDDATNETVTIRHSVSGYGAVTAAAAVTVIVNDDDTTQGEAEASEAAKEVADAVLEEVILPDVMQQLTARTTELITSRLTTTASGSPGDPLTISLDDVLTDTVAALHGQREHLKNGSLTWRQALSGRSFAFPLSGLTLARGESAGGQEHPFSSLVVWGGADYSSYGNTIEHTDADGNGFSGVIGMDLQPSPQLTTGLAITTSRWGLDYATNTTATTTNDATAEGTYEIGVTMLHPYVNWWATEHLSLWATFGYGRGEVEQTPEGDDTTTRTDALTSWAGGVRFEVVPAMDPLSGGEGAPFGLAFKADGATSSFLDTQVQLARLAAEVSRSFAVENGLLTTALELGWRLHSVSDKDGLDGLQQRIADKKDSGGAELAGRLNWRDSEGRLSATVDTRVVLGGGHHREWGMGGYLRFTPSRRAGEGLSLTLQPSFGVTGTRLDELWSLSGDGDLANNNDPPGARLDAELAYGVPLGDGLLTPYTEVAWEEGGSIYGAGLRYGLNRSLELDLKGARHRRADGNPENRLLLEVHSRL